MSDIRFTCLALLVAVGLICENKRLLHLAVILFDLVLVEVCCACVVIVDCNDLIKALLQVMRDLGLIIVVLKISAFGFCLHFLFIYGIKCFVVLALSHLVFSCRPQNR